MTALSNELTDPQASAWRDELRLIQAPALLIAGGPASHVDQDQLAGMTALILDCELRTIPAGHLVMLVVAGRVHCRLRLPPRPARQLTASRTARQDRGAGDRQDVGDAARQFVIVPAVRVWPGSSTGMA